MESEQGAEFDSCDYYKFTYNDLIMTCITSWYENRTLRVYAIPAMMRELPPGVVAYLKQDTMKLPTGVETSGTSAARIAKESDTPSSSEDDSDWDIESEDSVSGLIPKFDEFDGWIIESIKELGGAVFPKVNGNSPKDAAWVAFNRCLKCYIPGDIYLLLKCSSHILGDVIDDTIYNEDVDMHPQLITPHLILRKWVDISPVAEFRCFVIHNQLTGISQRDTTASYPSIKRDRDLIIEDIHRFYRHISNEISLTHYVFDVVREGTTRICLVDLNVFGLVTDPCLFTYKELKMIFDKMLQDTPSGVQDGGLTGLEKAEHFGNPIFKFIDNDKMLKFRSDLNAGPSI